MSTTLNKITTRAKKIRKIHPSMKWIDAVKKASIELRKDGTIGRAPAKKSSVKKRRITKKVINKKVSKNIHELSHYGRKKRSHKQIVAIAERQARATKKRAKPRKIISSKVSGISATDRNLLSNIEKAKSEIVQHEKRISALKEIGKLNHSPSMKLSTFREINKEKDIIRDKKKFISLMKKHL